MMTLEEQLCSVCEVVGFVRTVSKGMYYKTDEDVDDCFGNFIISCREYTFSRTHPDSEAILWKYNYTEIGPALDVKKKLSTQRLWNRDSDHLSSWRPKPMSGRSYPEAGNIT